LQPSPLPCRLLMLPKQHSSTRLHRLLILSVLPNRLPSRLLTLPRQCSSLLRKRLQILLRRPLTHQGVATSISLMPAAMAGLRAATKVALEAAVQAWMGPHWAQAVAVAPALGVGAPACLPSVGLLHTCRAESCSKMGGGDARSKLGAAAHDVKARAMAHCRPRKQRAWPREARRCQCHPPPNTRIALARRVQLVDSAPLAAVACVALECPAPAPATAQARTRGHALCAAPAAAAMASWEVGMEVVVDATVVAVDGRAAADGRVAAADEWAPRALRVAAAEEAAQPEEVVVGQTASTMGPSSAAL
jgi:hypothetical protein